MPIEVRVPPLGDSTSGATLANWLKKPGDRVRVGEALAEIETDKTMVELESPGTGVLTTIIIPAGTATLETGVVLALIEESDGVTLTEPAKAPRRPAAAVTPSINPPAPVISGADTATPVRAGATVDATPLAQQMAAIAGADLARIQVNGRRVTKADVERFIGRSEVPAPPATEDRRFEEAPLSAARRITAVRLQNAKQTIPHFYLQIDCCADALLEVRDQMRSQGTFKPTMTDFVVRAAALALGKVPLANSAWVNDTLRVYEDADIAVAVNTSSGLITPIIRAANQKQVPQISRELRGLIDRARENRLTPQEYMGGTFTISNLGMFGVTSLYAIVNPPQSGILGVGAVEQRPVVRDGRIEIGAMMTCTLSADHRALDGATGAEFLGQFRRLLEDPRSW